MKWNGQLLILIYPNLNLHINLDVDEKESLFVDLPDEIWTMILKYLSTEDIFSFKFLSKRFYRISFFDKKLKFFTVNAHKIFEVNEYYEMFFYMLKDLLNIFKKEFDDSIFFLLLKYSFEDLKNLFMISNCLYHLFSCPRTTYAKNECKHCPRVYISPFIQPKNFKDIENFKFNINDRKKILSKNSLSILNKFTIIVFFKSLEESSVINSDQKRCLKTFIVQDYFHLVIMFFEVQLRIFVNFFSKIVDCYINSYAKQKFFLGQCFIFCFEFVTYCIKKVKINFFDEIFSDYHNFNSNLKVINKKYIEYCNKKYAS